MSENASFKIEIFEEHQFVYFQLNGDINKEELERMNQALRDHPSYQYSYDGIFDFRNGKWAMKIEDFLEENRKIKQILKGFDVGKWAVLVASPKETAYSMLWSRNLQNAYQDGVFSTTEGAATFLNRNHAFILKVINEVSAPERN